MLDIEGKEAANDHVSPKRGLGSGKIWCRVQTNREKLILEQNERTHACYVKR